MKIRALLAATSISLLALAGCGTTDASKSEESQNATGAPVTVTDGIGEEIKLDRPAQKVVTLEWAPTEYVQALGVTPVGVADPDGYKVWDSAVPLQGETKNVGVRQEPSIDAITGLKPDLIIAAEGSIPEKQLADFKRIAPVATFKGATTKDLVSLVKSNQETIGKLLGKEDEAKKLSSEYDSKIESTKKRLEDAGKVGTPVVYSYPYKNANNIEFRMHAQGSAPSVVANAIGLKDAWTKAGDAEYGLAQSDTEGLSALPANSQFFYYSDPETANPIDSLKSNKVWQNLGFVKSGGVHRTQESVWLYGGTKSLEQMADVYADTLTK